MSEMTDRIDRRTPGPWAFNTVRMPKSFRKIAEKPKPREVKR